MDLPNVVPLLVYHDIERAHEWLTRVFGFRAGLLERDGSGAVMHAEVHQGEQVIWLHRVIENDGWVSAEGQPTSGELVVRVADVDAQLRTCARGGCLDRVRTDGPGLRCPRVRHSRSRGSSVGLRHATRVILSSWRRMPDAPHRAGRGPHRARVRRGALTRWGPALRGPA